MILSCPNCYSQFNVQDDAIGIDGRKVKCSCCKESWFQDPDPDWLAEKLAEQTDRLEEQLSHAADDVEEDSVEVDDSDYTDIPLVSNPGMEKSLVTYCVLFGGFILFMSYIFMNTHSAMYRNPGWSSFYALFGIGVNFPDERLSFDKVVASGDGQTLNVSGVVTNLSSNEIKLYPLRFLVLDENDGVVTQWYDYLDGHFIGPEESIEFETSYAFEDDHGRVEVRFDLDPKIALEGGDSSQVHHQSGSDHQSAHEVHEESRPHASSVPHQEPQHENHDSGHHSDHPLKDAQADHSAVDHH